MLVEALRVTPPSLPSWQQERRWFSFCQGVTTRNQLVTWPNCVENLVDSPVNHWGPTLPEETLDLWGGSPHLMLEHRQSPELHMHLRSLFPLYSAARCPSHILVLDVFKKRTQISDSCPPLSSSCTWVHPHPTSLPSLCSSDSAAHICLSIHSSSSRYRAPRDSIQYFTYYHTHTESSMGRWLNVHVHNMKAQPNTNAWSFFN